MEMLESRANGGAIDVEVIDEEDLESPSDN
jgi:hypothetical protein